MSVFGVRLVRIFPHSDWILCISPYWDFVSFRIQSECGKMRTRITPNTDTFHAVIANSFHPLTIFAKITILDYWQDSECNFVQSFRIRQVVFGFLKKCHNRHILKHFWGAEKRLRKILNLLKIFPGVLGLSTKGLNSKLF